MEEEKEYKSPKATFNYKLYNLNGLKDTYESSLKKLHPDIKWKHVDITNGYQGDIVSLGVDKEGVWYYKNNSYGSCSGCDWIQGISSETEAIEFYRNQENLDKLGTNKLKVIEYLENEIKNLWNFKDEHLEELKRFIEDERGE